MSEEKLREALIEAFRVDALGGEVVYLSAESAADIALQAIKSSGLILCDTSTHIVVPRFALDDLLNRVRPGSEAAPWVVDEIKKLLKAAEAGE